MARNLDTSLKKTNGFEGDKKFHVHFPFYKGNKQKKHMLCPDFSFI